jgi:hypothetical protein
MIRLTEKDLVEKIGEIAPEFRSSWRFFNEHASDVSDMLGKTIDQIYMPLESECQDVIIFECDDGSVYLMYHEQDCCESVEIEDICGELDWLIGKPLTKAEEVCMSNDDEGVPEPADGPSCYWGDSYTWTFYHFATLKGYVDIRWYGESNGYYSESVDFVCLRPASETVMVDGERLEVDHTNQGPAKDWFKMNKEVYIDVDISREMALIEEHMRKMEETKDDQT